VRTEDGYLISKCLSGEPETFGLLVDKYRSAIYAFAYARLGNFQDAEDVAQEVFLRAYQKLHTLKGYDSFLAWLYAIASNLCKKQLQARNRRLDRQYIEDQEESVLEGPSLEAYRRKAEYEPLYEALAELPELYREVLTLYYLGGMNSREIAQFLGTSTATIKSRLQRARELLKEEMIATMTTTFDEMKLQPSFTFRVVEAIKRTRIQTGPSKTALPFGVSAAVGLIALVLSLMVPHSPLYPIGELIGSALPSKTQVPEVGVIPVEMVDITKITILSSERGKKDFGQKPEPKMNAFAPPGQEGKWEKKADMLTPGVYSTCVVNGKVYAISWKTVQEYDPATDKWTKKADMPTARSFPAVSVVDGKIYVIGGFNGSNLPTVEEYDPETDRWTKKADMPTERNSLSTSVVNGKIYAIGGMRVWPVPLSTVEEYDPVADTWTKKADMLIARNALSTSVVNGKIYAIGGWDNVGRSVSTVEEYNPATDTWTKKAADIPTARFGLSTSVVNGKIYAIGGGLNNDVSFAATEEYDPATDTWTKKADMPTARQYVSTSAVNGKIYAIGGMRVWRAILPTVEEFDTGFREPQSVNPAGKLPTTWGEVKAAR